MNKKTVITIVVLGSGLVILTAQTAAPSIFTAAQAEAGRTAYENGCGKCHTYRLLGRKGEEGELPPAASLPAGYQKFIGKLRVPPLVGKSFLDKWGQKTVAEIIDNFQRTSRTPVFELNMDEDTIVNLTAYILQANGAKAGSQPLTKTMDVVVNPIVP